MALGRKGWMDKERGEVRRGIGEQGVGTCARGYVDAWRRQHDKQTTILEKKKNKKPLSKQRYAKRKRDECRGREII